MRRVARSVSSVRWTVVALVTLWSASAVAAPVRLGTGSKGGDFELLGRALAVDLGEDLELAPEITKGSCENIRRLLEGSLDFALVQYDVAAEAHRASLSAVPETMAA